MIFKPIAFLSRQLFKPESGLTAVELSDLFSEIGSRFEMDRRFIDRTVPHRTLSLVSKFDHCLNDLLYRKHSDELNIEVTTVASNHPEFEPLAKFHQAPYVVLPSGKSKLTTKAVREECIELIDEQHVELVVLARYMQVLFDESCQDLAVHCINIHHSFLPSFTGARPYHQAFERGVKAIGATVHYVTTDLTRDQSLIKRSLELTRRLDWNNS